MTDSPVSQHMRSGGGGEGGGRGSRKKSISPSLRRHPHRPVAAVSRERLPVLALGSHASVDASIAGTLADATRARCRKTRARDEDEGRCGGGGGGAGGGAREGEAGWSDCEMCLPSEIQLLSSAPRLAASYSLSFCFSISPSRSTHALPPPAAWQPLVSLTHSQHWPTPPPPQHSLAHRSNTGTDAAVRPSNGTPIPSRRVRLFLKTSLGQDVRGIARLGREEECCRAPLPPGKCCCKGIFGSAQHYPPSVVSSIGALGAGK